MSGITEVRMGGLEVVAATGGELKTFVGSCVALCLFDPVSKVAAMAHIMLPKKTGGIKPDDNSDLGKYADEAFDIMLHRMTKMGAQQSRIRAKIAGGAAIFSHESEGAVFNIGSRNLAAIKEILVENNIAIVSEDVGGNFGRWVRFDIVAGGMTITSSLKKSEKTI